MTKEQLKQSAKDEAAREYGHGDFQQALGYLVAGGDVMEFQDIEDRAMEIYAEKVNEQSLKLLERASNLVGSPLIGVSGSTDLACEIWEKDYSQFKTTKP